MRLSVQMAAVLSVTSIVPLIVAGAFATRIATEKATRSSEEILMRDANQVATFVDTWANAQVDALGGWMVPFRLGNNPTIQDSLLMAVVRAMPAVVDAVLVDKDGLQVGEARWMTEDLQGAGRFRILGSPERASQVVGLLGVSEALEHREAARQAGLTLATGSVVGTPYLPVGGQIPSIPVAIAGPYDDDLVLGAEITLADVDRLVSSQTTPTHGVTVLGEDGSTVVGGGHPLVDAQVVGKLLHTGINAITFSYALADGTPVSGALASVPSTHWTVVVVEPTEIVDAAAIEIRRSNFEVLGVAIVLAISVGAVVARSLTQPVQDLRDVALAVAEGDLGRRVDAERADELGELAKAFNHMSATLAKNRKEINHQREEIQAFNRELQARVDARTRDLVAAQQRLVESGQLAAVAELGAGMAHELNNPLAAILGLAQVLKARAQGTPEESTLARIEEQAARAREVVMAMLRLSSGEMDPGGAPVVDLRAVLREVVGLVSGPFRQRGIALDFVEPEVSLEVRVDPVAASRIFAQILNSLRAGLGEGTTLSVHGEASASEVAIVFRPSRAVAVGEDDWMATGMGLWVARRMLDQVGGRLERPAENTDWRLHFGKST